MSFIEVKNVNKIFSENHHHVLKDITFTINHGERVAILGKSGTGKTLLFKLLSGFISCTSGDIIINNQNIQSIHQNKIFDIIGFMFQNCGLVGTMNVISNVCLNSSILDIGDKLKKNIQHAKEYLDLVGIMPDAYYKSINEISGGMQKKVALARVMFNNPQMILFDEPNAGLDPSSSIHIANTIKNLHEKKQDLATMIITHDLIFAKEIANRIIFMHQGEIIFDGSINDFFKSQNTIILDYLAYFKVF